MKKIPRIISLDTKFKATKKIIQPWHAVFTTGKYITPIKDLYYHDDVDGELCFSEYIDYRIRFNWLSSDGFWMCELMNDEGNIMTVDSSPNGWLKYFSIVNL